MTSLQAKKSSATPVLKSRRLTETKPSYKSRGFVPEQSAFISHSKEICPFSGISNLLVEKNIFFALSSICTWSLARLSFAVARIRSPSTTMTALGSLYRQNEPSGNGKPPYSQERLTPVMMLWYPEYVIVSSCSFFAVLLVCVFSILFSIPMLYCYSMYFNKNN